MRLYRHEGGEGDGSLACSGQSESGEDEGRHRTEQRAALGGGSVGTETAVSAAALAGGARTHVCSGGERRIVWRAEEITSLDW